MNSNPSDPSNANESSAELEATSHDAIVPEDGPSGEGESRPANGEARGAERAVGEENELSAAAAVPALDDAELIELEQRANERDLYRDELLRARADLDNYQKRVRRERPQWEDHAVRRLVADLLPVIDNFERALSARDESQGDALAEGVRLIHQMLLKALSDHGVEEIPALGESFDPELHEAVAVEETQEGRDHRICIEVQLKGYVHKGVVVRPSMVKVAKRVESARRAEPSDSEN